MWRERTGIEVLHDKRWPCVFRAQMHEVLCNFVTPNVLHIGSSIIQKDVILKCMQLLLFTVLLRSKRGPFVFSTAVAQWQNLHFAKNGSLKVHK